MRNSFAGISAIAAATAMAGLVGAVSGGAAALRLLAEGWGAAEAAAGGQQALDVVSLAITASTVLLFARLGVESVERRLLAAVDEATARQLLGRFRQYGAATDPRAASAVRLCEKLLETVHAAVSQHDAALNKALTAASRRWEEAATTAAALLHRTVGDALVSGLKEHAQSLNDGVARHAADLENVLIRHAEILSENIDRHTGGLADALEHHTAVITQTETNLAEENRRCLGELEGALGEAVLLAVSRQEKLITQSEELLREMRTALVEAAGTSVAQQEQLVRQSDTLLKVVEASGHVRRLEEALNSNLAALASSHRFEETVVGLSAALQLLSANLGRPLTLRDGVSLDGDEPMSQAA
jgi:hypothetical protein